jgi:O-antigen/teichoic acid export membrane protein
MERSLSETIARNYIFGVGARVAMRVLAWLFSVFVIRGLGAAEYGKYSQVLAYMAIFSIFGDLGISTLAQREIAKDHSRTRGLFWNIRVVRFLLAFVVLLLATGSAWLLGRPQDLVLGIFFASCEGFLYVFQGPVNSVLIGYERVDYASSLTVLAQSLYPLVGMFVMLNGYGFIGLVFATWPGVIAFAAVGEWLIRKKLKADISFQIAPNRWWSLIQSGFPFGLTTFTNMLSFRLDTILLGLWITDAAVGQYNAAYNLIFTLLTLTGSLNGALLPSLSRVFVQDRARTQAIFQRVIRYLFIFSLPIAVGTTILARDIVLTLYGNDLAGAITPLQVLIWVLPILTFTSLCGSITTVFHLEKQTARVNVVNAMANFALNLYAIPNFGLLGASVATVLTELIGLLQFGIILRRDFDWGGILRSFAQPLIAAAVMAIGVLLVRDSLQLWAVGAGAGFYISASYILGVWTFQELKTLSKTMVRGII